MLLGSDPSKQPNQPLPIAQPQVTFAYIKHMYNSNKKVGLSSSSSLDGPHSFDLCLQEEAFGALQTFVKNPSLLQTLESAAADKPTSQQQNMRKLLAKWVETWL